MKKDNDLMSNAQIMDLSLKEIDYLIKIFFLKMSEFNQTDLSKRLQISRGHPILQKIMAILTKKNIVSYRNSIGSCKFYLLNNRKLREFILEQNKLKLWIDIMPSKFDIVKWLDLLPLLLQRHLKDSLLH